MALELSAQKLRVDYRVDGIKLTRHSDTVYKVAWKPGSGMFVADAVVLAVGFGVEVVTTTFPPVNRYWDDDDIIGFRDGEGTWLVSGCGDGGLLLQGTTYAAVGLGVALSSILGGFMVERAGFPAAFATLAAVGSLATLFFAAQVREPQRRAHHVHRSVT